MSIPLEQLLSKAKELEKNSELIKKIEEGKRQLKIFLEKYPFREKPEMIDSLTPEKIYNPGSDDYFFLWIEHKTRSLGAIFVYGGKVYPNVVEKIDQFKQLLKVLVDDKKTIRENVEANIKKNLEYLDTLYIITSDEVAKKKTTQVALKALFRLRRRNSFKMKISQFDKTNYLR